MTRRPGGGAMAQGWTVRGATMMGSLAAARRDGCIGRRL